MGDIIDDRIDVSITQRVPLNLGAYRIQAVGLYGGGDCNIIPRRLAEAPECRFSQTKIVGTYQRVIVSEQ